MPPALGILGGLATAVGTGAATVGTALTTGVSALGTAAASVPSAVGGALTSGATQLGSAIGATGIPQAVTSLGSSIGAQGGQLAGNLLGGGGGMESALGPAGLAAPMEVPSVLTPQPGLVAGIEGIPGFGGPGGATTSPFYIPGLTIGQAAPKALLTPTQKMLLASAGTQAMGKLVGGGGQQPGTPQQTGFQPMGGGGQFTPTGQRQWWVKPDYGRLLARGGF